MDADAGGDGSVDVTPRPVCGPGCACAIGNEFGEKAARRGLRIYRRSGPDRTTRWLIEGLRGGAAGDVGGLTVLDIGGGVGAVHLELIRAGVAAATDVDGSPAYVAAARDEAARQGVADRVTWVEGDFVDQAASVGPVDLVALDRVICCYPDMTALVQASVGRARLRYGLVYPRDTWWIRAGSRAFNVVSRLVRSSFRSWVHRTAAVDLLVREAGFVPSYRRSALFWQVVVYERAGQRDRDGQG